MKRLLASLALLLGLIAPALGVTPTTSVSNAAYSILNTDVRVVTTTTAFTASRTWTLPFAAATCIGQTCAPGAMVLEIFDAGGAITQTNTLVVAPQSGDTINGQAANLILAQPGARVILYPTSGNNWVSYTVGNVVTAALAQASAISLTTATGKDITTVSLGQGTWSCQGQISRNLGATTSVTILKTSITTTQDTSGSLDTGTMSQFSTAANVMVGNTSMDVGPIIVTPTATTTYHLVAQDTFTVSTNAGYGQITCQQLK